MLNGLSQTLRGRQALSAAPRSGTLRFSPKPPHREGEGPDALLVSAADKLHNARAIVSDLRTHGPGMFSRFNAGQDGTLWYYGALARVFARRLPGPLARELSDAVAQMQSLATKANAPS